jgi:hypothetical protein
MRKSLLLLTTMALALLLAAGVALAQAPTQHINQTLPVDFNVDDEACSGELIHFFTGEVHSVFHLTLDDAGNVQHLASQHTFANAKGTGDVSGGQYTLLSKVTNTVNSNLGGFPIVTTETASGTLIGQGQLPDSTFHQVLHFTIHEDGTVTAEVVQSRFECSEGSQ